MDNSFSEFTKIDPKVPTKLTTKIHCTNNACIHLAEEITEEGIFILNAPGIEVVLRSTSIETEHFNDVIMSFCMHSYFLIIIW